MSTNAKKTAVTKTAPKGSAKKGKSTEAADRKEKKMTLATEIYQKHLPKKDKMTKREFRALVVEDFKKHLGLENPGTIGMYYSIVDKRVTGRAFKTYNRVAERKPNRSPEEKVTAREQRAAQRDARRAERAAAKAARAALKVGKHPKGSTPGDALNVIANEAFDKISKIAGKARHAAEILGINEPKQKAARKTAPKKAAAKKTAAKKSA